MSVLGVRTDSGVLVWVDAGEHVPEPLDRVRLECAGEQMEGAVVVTADMLIRGLEDSAGTVLEIVRRRDADPQCEHLPQADLPPLGTQVHAGGVRGMVIALDVVHRRVTVRQGTGPEVTVLAEEIQLGDSSSPGFRSGGTNE